MNEIETQCFDTNRNFFAVVYEKKRSIHPIKMFRPFVNLIEIRYSRLSQVSDATKSLFAK